MAVSKERLTQHVSDYLFKRFLASGVVFNPSIPFAELGIDSMTVVELVMYIEEEFGIEIPADQLTQNNLSSLSALADCAMQHQLS
ncbi:MAG: Phosphopantetheine attachment site [Bacteroidota bacterium]|jgi:acyl carrier protein